MMRGNLVTIALQGDHGKPRPALIIQSDQFPGTTPIAEPNTVLTSTRSACVVTNCDLQ